MKRALLGLGLSIGMLWAAPSVEILNASSVTAQNQPVTFGYVFAPGDIPAGKTLSAAASGSAVSIQTDTKATHADGSLRHAIITLTASLAPGASEKITFAPGPMVPMSAPVQASELLATNYDAVVTLTLGGTVYTVSAKSALQTAIAASKAKSWLAGPLVSEWIVSTPFATSAGVAHPHLSAQFALRAYAGLQSIRMDITVENDWAFEPNPSGLTYDVSISVGGQNVYTKTALAHTHHTRWRKVFWWGVDPGLESKLDRDYLIGTGAVPNYDRSVTVASAALAELATAFEPMSSGNWTQYMPQTGAHDDIGPLPSFAAVYLLSIDARAKASVLANGICGGSFQIHYRDKTKNLPVSLDDYPYMTILGNPGDAVNPATGKSELFPTVTNGLDTLTPDDAHQPSIAYLPYLITGDYFFLEELQFWANWNMVIANPYYRDFKKGLLKWGQVRAQGWSMRTLGDAAYATPDNHPLKAYFVEKLKNNVDWYTAHEVGNDSVNKLGWLDAGSAIAYAPYGIAPWQDAFFTYSIGHLVRMGFTDALPFLKWKSKFIVGMMADPGYCWLNSTAYSLQIGTADESKMYATFAELYQANYPAGTCVGLAMDGYPDEPEGCGANMQPALAAAVDAGIPSADAAWTKYVTRNPKQNYSSFPQFAVIPLTLSGSAIRAVRRSELVPAKSFRLHFQPGDADIRIEMGEGQGEGIRTFDLRGHEMPEGMR